MLIKRAIRVELNATPRLVVTSKISPSMALWACPRACPIPKKSVMKPSAAFLRNETGKWTQDEHEGKSLYSRQVPYSGVVVLLGDEEQLLVVSGFDKVESATELLTSMGK